ncbi:MAG: hypothetical protein KBT75_13455, partial [Oleispira antarctica]|nr:hypothetical protein [Oleispira antarctica]
PYIRYNDFAISDKLVFSKYKAFSIQATSMELSTSSLAIDFLALDFHFDAEVYVAKGRGWDRSFYKRPLGVDRYKTTSNTLNKSHTILATMEDGARFFTPAVTILFEDNFEFLGIESVEVVKGGIIFVIEESPMKNLLTKHSLNLSGIEDNVETTEIKNNDKIIKFSDDLCRLLNVNLRT